MCRGTERGAPVASQHYPASTRANPECAALPPRLRTETRYAARAVDTGGRHAAVEVAKGLLVEPLPTFAGRRLAADDGTVDDALPTVIGCRRSAGGDGQEQAEGGQKVRMAVFDGTMAPL